MARVTLRIRQQGEPISGDRLFKIWSEEVVSGMQLVLGETAEVARLLAPTGVSQIYKNALDHVVEKKGATGFRGLVFSGDEPVKSQVIEGVDAQGNENQYGRQPGTFAPVQAIMAWTAFKFGIVDPEELRRAAYRVNLKIFKEGIVAVRPIKNAVNIKMPEFDRLMTQEVPRRVAERL